MRAAVLDRDLTVREWPTPEPGSGEARIALTKVGICGSDVHFAVEESIATRFRPIILGHEPAGVVESLGPGTPGPRPGTRVAVVPLVTCGACRHCASGRSALCPSCECLGAHRHGCWADFVVVPVANLVELPDTLPDEIAAVATDSVATAYHATVSRGGVGQGSRVVIWGAGGLGGSAVGIARAVGAGYVVAVDPRPEARARALVTGADEALDPDVALERIGGRMDVALEFVGRSDTLEAAVRSLDTGGRAVAVGLGTGAVRASHLNAFVLRERELVGAYGSGPEEVREVIRLLASGALALPGLVGEIVPLAGVRAALQRVAEGRNGGSRIVVDVRA